MFGRSAPEQRISIYPQVLITVGVQREPRLLANVVCLSSSRCNLIANGDAGFARVLFAIVAATIPERGHVFRLLVLVEAEEGGMDDFVFMNQGGAAGELKEFG